MMQKPLKNRPPPVACVPGGVFFQCFSMMTIQFYAVDQTQKLFNTVAHKTHGPPSSRKLINICWWLQEERKVKEHAARVEHLAQEAHNTKLISLEEQQFQEYAAKVIDHCEKGGRNVYPLKKAARVRINQFTFSVQWGVFVHVLYLCCK